MNIKTKFGIGEKVYLVGVSTFDISWVPCDLCNASGRITVSGKSGRHKCPKCSGTKNKSHVDYETLKTTISGPFAVRGMWVNLNIKDGILRSYCKYWLQDKKNLSREYPAGMLAASKKEAQAIVDKIMATYATYPEYREDDFGAKVWGTEL